MRRLCSPVWVCCESNKDLRFALITAFLPDVVVQSEGIACHIAQTDWGSARLSFQVRPSVHMPKNIVICCDGTANEATGESTNVLRIFRSLIRSDQQLCYYDGGVGTLTDSRAITMTRKAFLKALDLAVATSIRDNFCEAYAFLVRHYEPGDNIYMFGFSRGAYTVRAVAGAIKMLGLLRPELEGQVPYVWATYADEDQSRTAKRRFGGGQRFKKCFAVDHEVRISFMGVFDTVSSVGWIWDWQSFPYTANNNLIDHVRHALAIDERRACFNANLFFPKSETTHLSIKQVWFAGCHCDVGGGYAENESALSKLPLQWMFRESEANGLLVDAVERDRMIFRDRKPGIAPDPSGMLHESLQGLWKLVEFFPRRSWSNAKKSVAWQAPHVFRARDYGLSPVIHQSARDRHAVDSSYKRPLFDEPLASTES